MKNEKNFRPDRIFSYFRVEWLPLAFVTLSGLIYNIGLLATPWFEGRLAQCLADILSGSETAAQMALLALAYILVTLLVQASRFIKRFYVRRFANNINRRMKGILYANLVRQSRVSLEKEGAGELMTKAISDVDDCVEGMRKFTTEVFDTGVALAGHVVMLLVYDWRLALLSLLFTPFSYVCAAWMKKPVQRAGAAYKKAAGALSAATLDRAQNAVTYRIYGCEDARVERYEEVLDTYEKTAVKNNVWQSALPPLYLAASEAGVTVHFVVRRKECPRHRLACVGHRGLYHLPFLLHQAGGQILQGGQALQLGAEGRGLLEAHQTSDEVAGAAGRAGCPGGGRCDPQEPLLRLRRHPHLLGSESDSPSRRHHRCHRPGGLRKIHLWPGLPLRGPL
ncbi:MAG: ABC transporter transmembrane domain-containing protein [Faecalibacterium prausnitzii]